MKKATVTVALHGSGDKTRTCDLWVMSPTSYQLLHPAIYFFPLSSPDSDLCPPQADMSPTSYQLLHPAIYFFPLSSPDSDLCPPQADRSPTSYQQLKSRYLCSCRSGFRARESITALTANIVPANSLARHKSRLLRAKNQVTCRIWTKKTSNPDLSVLLASQT